MSLASKWLFVRHLAVGAVLWTVITGGASDSWVVGAPVVVLAAAAGLWLGGGRGLSWSLMGLLGFVPYFIRFTIAGGVDVARRAFDPALPLRPGLLQYHLRLRNGLARVFFMDSVSLLPGTLSASIRGDELTVHVVDLSQPNEEQLKHLEQKVARLFNEDLSPQSAGAPS